MSLLKDVKELTGMLGFSYDAKAIAAAVRATSMDHRQRYVSGTIIEAVPGNVKVTTVCESYLVAC